MKIIVQKFGGTSVASEAGWKCLAAKVQEAKDRGFSPVVVVSAMGRYPAPYATDSLLSLVKGQEDYSDSREKDMLMACGEIISAVVVSHYLRSLGLPARAFSGAKAGIYTCGPFAEARVESVNPVFLLEAVNKGDIPVVAGFQGEADQAEIATLGRGGSDTTAVALGAALRADLVEIYTDVEGVMTADPRFVKSAQVLEKITHLEVGEMANEGAKVLHPRAVDMAEAHGLPLAVRSTFSEAPGTLIASQGASGSPAADTSGRVNIVDKKVRPERLVTGVVTVTGHCAVTVDFSGNPDTAAARLQVINELAAAGISLDMINAVESKLYFLIRSSELAKAKKLLEKLGYSFTVRMGCGKVSVVGQAMRGQPGVMLRICRSLAKSGIELFYSTDSHITISCVVPEAALADAAMALHSEFGLDV